MEGMLDKLGIKRAVKISASKSNDAIIRKGHFSVYRSHRRTR